MIKQLLLLTAFCCQLLVAQQVKFFNTYGTGIFDSGEGVWTTKDTAYVVGGITTPYGMNGTDMLIYKVDSLGALQWYKNIGMNNSIEGAKSITCGKGGTEFVLAGYQNSYDTSGYNFYAVKTDLNGDTLWTKVYGGSDWDMAYSVDTLQDSTYVIAGETYSFGNGNSDMYVIRIDKDGDTLWTRTFGGSNDDFARYVFTDKYNRIMVIGSTYSFGAGGSDVYLVLLNTAGDTIWTRAYGTAVDEFGLSGDMFYNFSNLMSYAFAYTQFNPVSSSQEARYFRGDSISGALVYDHNWFFGTPEKLDNMKIRKEGQGRFYISGNFYLTGTNPADPYIHRTDYGIIFSGVNSSIYFQPGDQSTNDIRKCLDGGFVITGNTTNFGPGATATFIMKTDTDLVTTPVPVVDVEEIPTINFGIYPNPVTDHMVIIDAGTPIQTIRLFDFHGRMVQYVSGENFANQAVYIENLPYGMYIIEVTTSNGIGRKKLFVIE